MNKVFVRNILARRYLDTMLVLAVVTILVTRVFLFLTGWPTIGGATLHIAHMLWGGLLMLAAMILLFGFLDRKSQNLAAIFGGIGFGLFIDEVGKFVTRNNDYFFQPTFTIIYFVFIAFYFVIREIDKQVPLNKVEQTINVLEISKEIFLHDLNAEERTQLLNLLSVNPKHSKVFNALMTELSKTRLAPVTSWQKTTDRFDKFVTNFLKQSITANFIWVLLILQGLVFAISFGRYWLEITSSMADRGIVIMGISFAVFSFLFIISGLSIFNRNRYEAYRKFYKANLLAVFLIQPFAFYVATILPLFALGINLVSIFALQYLIEQEQKKIVVNTETSPAG